MACIENTVIQLKNKKTLMFKSRILKTAFTHQTSNLSTSAKMVRNDNILIHTNLFPIQTNGIETSTHT